MSKRVSFFWKRFLLYGVVGLCCAATAGCVHLKEAGRCIWGTSVAHLDRARADGRALDVTLDRDAAFETIEKILTDSGARVYLKARDKAYLAAMNFTGHVDTTQVGVFFEPRSEHATRIEVASLSPSLVDQVAQLLIAKLGQQVSLPEKGEST